MKKRKTKFEPKMKTLTDKLWALCRQLVSGKDCYTCGAKNLQGANKQLGHGYPKGALGVSMQYDLRILRWQCWNCNLNLGGCGAIFWKNLERDLGKAEADKLFAECQASKGKTIKSRPFILALTETYKKKLDTFAGLSTI